MKILCPDCGRKAILEDGYSYVECKECGFQKSYGEYIKYIAYKDKRYSDILGDYK